MASLLAQNRSLAVLVLASFFHQLAAFQVAVDFFQFCVRYYGTVSAEVTFPNRGDHKNYNNTITCPSHWDFDDVAGAVLDICPTTDELYYPDGSDIEYTYRPNGDMITVELSLEGASNGVIDEPIGSLSFRDIHITNSSYASKPQFQNKRPAVLTALEPLSDKFAINGTASALFNDDASVCSVNLNCNALSNDELAGKYCGYRDDDMEGGCWTSQTFIFNQSSTLNYTIAFSDTEATMDIWTEAPYIPDTIDPKPAGYSTAVHFTIRVGTEVPTVTYQEFWDNTDIVYEEEKEREESSHTALKADSDGMPLFMNITNTDWYSAANGSFSMEPVFNGAIGVFSSLPVVLFTSVTTGIFLLA